MGKIGIWKVNPLKNEIILTLIRHKGEMLDSELLRVLSNIYSDINQIKLNHVLFELEVEMVIEVTRVKKNVNKISLRKNAPIDPSLLKIFNNNGNNK
ncbi:MAG: hypothetical protein ACTSU2_11710 [Promethearchaeota archaeon]